MKLILVPRQLGINDEIGDSAFDEGMLKDAQNLGDQGTTPPSGTFSPDWDPAFKKEIHGKLPMSTLPSERLSIEKSKSWVIVSSSLICHDSKF